VQTSADKAERNGYDGEESRKVVVAPNSYGISARSNCPRRARGRFATLPRGGNGASRLARMRFRSSSRCFFVALTVILAASAAAKTGSMSFSFLLFFFPFSSETRTHIRGNRNVSVNLNVSLDAGGIPPFAEWRDVPNPQTRVGVLHPVGSRRRRCASSHNARAEFIPAQATRGRGGCLRNLVAHSRIKVRWMDHGRTYF